MELWVSTHQLFAFFTFFVFCLFSNLSFTVLAVFFSFLGQSFVVRYRYNVLGTSTHDSVSGVTSSVTKWSISHITHVLRDQSCCLAYISYCVCSTYIGDDGVFNHFFFSCALSMHYFPNKKCHILCDN